MQCGNASVINASGAIRWPNLELMQVAPSGDQIWKKCNQFKCYWNQSWTIPAERLTQDMESIPWVRCASGNVSSKTRLFSLHSFSAQRALFSSSSWSLWFPKRRARLSFPWCPRRRRSLVQCWSRWRKAWTWWPASGRFPDTWMQV